MRTQQQPIDRARLTVSSIVNTLAVSRAPGPGPRRSVGARVWPRQVADARGLGGAGHRVSYTSHSRPRSNLATFRDTVYDPALKAANLDDFLSHAVDGSGDVVLLFFPEGGAWGRLRLSTALVPSNTAFPALPEDVIMKGMFGLAPLRYDIMAHHINLNSYSTPNSVCAAATAPLPGYQATTMASQHVSILCCYTCQGSQGGDGCPADDKDTLGNASFIDHHGGPHRPQL